VFAVLVGSLVVAQKELVDHFRDTRSLVSAALYTLMGPAIVALLATSVPLGGPRGAIMASVFVLVAAFTGGMTVATDTLAGERERRSLLPLILSSPAAAEILVGKWLTSWVFAAISATIAALGFAVLLASLAGNGEFALWPLLKLIPALAILCALAASLDILFSTVARNVKEATAYVSMLAFVTMGIGMWLAFRPARGSDLWLGVPVAGHQRLFQAGFSGQEFSLLGSMMLALTSGALAVMVLVLAAQLFRRNEVNYRN
jgi:sodium transport system permease protein